MYNVRINFKSGKHIDYPSNPDDSTSPHDFLTEFQNKIMGKVSHIALCSYNESVNVMICVDEIEYIEVLKQDE